MQQGSTHQSAELSPPQTRTQQDSAEPLSPGTDTQQDPKISQEAVFAQFPEHRIWMALQMAEIERLVPEPSPSLVNEAELSRQLEDSAKWLKRQERRTKKNKEWLEERSHWAEPAPLDPENAEVRDIIENLHLYHVQDDSDIERIKEKLARHDARKNTTSTPNKRPSVEPQVQQPSPRDIQRSSRGRAPQRDLAEEWRGAPPDQSSTLALRSSPAGVGAQLGPPFTPTRPSGQASGNTLSFRSSQAADASTPRPDQASGGARSDASFPFQPSSGRSDQPFLPSLRLESRSDMSFPSRQDSTRAWQRRQAEWDLNQAERKYWGDDQSPAGPEQNATPTGEDTRRSRRLSSPGSRRTAGYGDTPPARSIKKRGSGLILRLRNVREDPQLEQPVDQTQFLNLPDDDPDTAEAPGGGKEPKGKGRRSKANRGITQFERYVIIEDQLKNQRVEPIDNLPAEVTSALNTAIDELFDQYEERAGLVTDPDNSKSYVDSNVCVWQHIISKAKAQPTRKFEAGCTTCGKNGRPCTLLQRRQGSGEVILVTYPRHEKHAPQNAKATEIAYWV
jgi:hypothetical protein